MQWAAPSLPGVTNGRKDPPLLAPPLSHILGNENYYLGRCCSSCSECRPPLHLDVDAPGGSARRARCVIHFLVSRCCQRFGERDSNDRGNFLPCNFFTNPLRSKHSAGSECRLRWSCNRRGAFDGPTIFHSCSR